MIVITMTSWPGRIQHVSRAIYNFFKTQTKKPDLFYLFLSIEEFKNKESDLPQDLKLIINAYNIKLMWTKENEYCHKRWYVYPKHFNDTVICIDDDCTYDKDLVKFASTFKDKRVYTIFNNLTNEMICEESIKIRYERTIGSSNTIKFSGNSIFPPGTFPLEAISPENIELRKKYCKKCDESWLMPFLIYNEIPRTYSYKQKIQYNSKDPKFKGTAIYYTNKTNFDVHWKHIQIYIVLRMFPKLMDKWKQLFPLYDTTEFDNKTIEEVCSMIS